MKYLSLVFVLFYVFSLSAMYEEKPRRDCCYLAGLAKNILVNAPGAAFYSSEEYAHNLVISGLGKLQKILEVSSDTPKQKTE